MGTALAARADQVAVELRAGDAEGARAHAIALRKAVNAAIQAGRVPPELQQHLLGAANALVAAIPPPPPPPLVEEEEDDEDDGEGKGKGKGKGKDKDDDE